MGAHRQHAHDGRKRTGTTPLAAIAAPGTVIGRRIKALREARGMSQDDLAQRVEVSRQTISNWERARTIPDALALGRIAEAFDTTPDDVLGEGARRVRDRAAAARREVVMAGGIVLAVQLVAGVRSGMDIAAYHIAGAAQLGTFCLGVAVVGVIWLVTLMRRCDLRTVRQTADFASLAARRPNSPTDRLLRFVCRWFWTCYFCSYTVAATCGMLAGVASGAAEPAMLATNLIMLGPIAIAWTWERHRRDA